MQSIFEANWQEHLDDLKTLVRIPSVSFEGFPESEVKRSAEAVATLLKKRGLENIEILNVEGGTHPYVYADWLHAPGKPTLLLNAHHDVQPAGREEIWKSKPFEPTLRDGPGGERLFGRGTADDKAGVIVHTAAIATWLEKTGKLPVNVKLVIEGEEEIGSPSLEQFLQKYHQKVQADIMVLTDTGNFDCGVPSITVALRGLVELGIELRALDKTIHSGMWGGPVPDSAMALCKVLAELVDENGRIAVPEIWAQVPPLTREEEEEFKRIPQTDAEFRKQSGMIPAVKLLKEGPSAIAQTWRFPSLTVNAFQASSRANQGNIINDMAWAKVTVRVSQGMDPEKVSQQLRAFIEKRIPWGLEATFESSVATPAWSTDAKGPVYDAALRSLEKGYGHPVVKIGCGGTIPFVGPFARVLKGAPAVLIGVEDPYTNAHGENESLLISDFKKGCMSQIHLFEELGKLTLGLAGR